MHILEKTWVYVLGVYKYQYSIMLLFIYLFIMKDKAAESLQQGVACRAGAGKTAHGVRRCIGEHWMDEDFVFFKVDMRNAFNVVSRQAVLDECVTFSPELIPWVFGAMGPTSCYGTHLVKSVLNMECSKVTPWVLCCLL